MRYIVRCQNLKTIRSKKMDLRQYLMNCDLEDLNESTQEMYEDIANMRMLTEQYWRDRISHENQSN